MAGPGRLARRALTRMRGLLHGTLVAVRTSGKLIALTFDDGPDPASTPRLLEVLARRGAKATFFMVARRAAAHPELVARVAAEGHAIGNHTWSHPSLPLLSAGEIDDEMRRAKAALAPHGAALMRPPYGHQDPASFRAVRRHGYEVVAWNVSAGDWLDEPAGPMADRLMPYMRPGAIVLMHDALYAFEQDRYRDRAPTIAAVGMLLERLSDHRFVTVSELMRAGRPVRRYWAMAPDRAALGALRFAEP